MKNNKTIYLAAVILVINWLGITYVHANNQNRAKAYYFAAEESYENKKYEAALKSIKKVESLLGKSNAALSALTVKILFGQQEYQAAKEELDHFFNYNANKTLTKEMSSYLLKIDIAIERKIAKEIEQKKQDRLAQNRELERVRREAERKRREPLERIKKDYEHILEKDKIANKAYDEFKRRFPNVANGAITQKKINDESISISAADAFCFGARNNSPECKKVRNDRKENNKKVNLYNDSRSLFKKFFVWFSIRQSSIGYTLDVCEEIKGTSLESEASTMCDDLRSKEQRN